MLTAWPFVNGSIVRYYYGSFVYEDLISGGSRSETYDEGIMEVTKEMFLKWANRLPEMATARKMVPQPA